MEFVLDQNLDYFKDFMMIIRETMYGLKSSGARYLDKFAESMLDLS